MSLVPSSSGHENRFIPRVPWILTWTVALSLLVVGLVSAESVWRALGYRPSVVDSPALWKFWYERALHGGPRTITLIGASRIQAGISTTQMHRRLPGYGVVQLGRHSGGSPIGVLQALAFDERFNGIVICDTLAPFLARANWDDQRRDYESPASTTEQQKAVTSAFSQDILSLRSRETGIFAALKHLVDRGRLPLPEHVRMRADRSLELDFTHIADLEAFRAKKVASYRATYGAAQHPTPEELDEDFQRVDEFISRIQARGGQVVFLRMPSSGDRLELEEEYHPKAKYWDRFAAMSNGICIHSTELEGASELTCPDDSHLDCDGAIQFTNALIDELFRRRALKVR